LTHLIDTDSLLLRIIIILGVALLAHLLVGLLRYGFKFLTSRDFSRKYPKIRSVTSLAASVTIFAVYFLAVGFALNEMGISLKAYLASATVIGLAVGFGSQGIVQDIVTGLTLVFSDLIDVGEMIEVSGQTGIVKSIGMRFVVIENALGARVYIPNRTVGNVVQYPRGCVRCHVDILLPADEDRADGIKEIASRSMKDSVERFPGIHVREPSVEGERKTSTGNCYLRLKFRIWPGRGTLIETAFKQQLLKTIQEVEPDYADWMITILYEMEKQPG